MLRGCLNRDQKEGRVGVKDLLGQNTLVGGKARVVLSHSRKSKEVRDWSRMSSEGLM
jgi:hypothetical protein